MLSPDLSQITAHIHARAVAYDAAIKNDRHAPAPTFLIDGPSGSGKTTLAAEIEKHWNSAVKLQVVHMDDLYPGWDGLAEGSATALALLHERATGVDTHWQRYDWATEKFTQWHSVDAREPLLIEGCGSMALGSESLSQVRIWLDAETELRRERALSRAGENFAEHWTQWDVQYENFVTLHNPQALATLEVSASE
ncbi:uridine kinase [Aurantimicrobium minutum]|uniref:AAA family ATPase n=1 Tax=Aurantimicrobium minutum TaxID=708131 RepID=UPI0024737CEC|nr:ATP-binding protein [Aurantimicrobium minutum]MDH6277483.1 uridine kinase [Aurantimicrobium minutum]